MVTGAAKPTRPATSLLAVNVLLGDLRGQRASSACHHHRRHPVETSRPRWLSSRFLSERKSFLKYVIKHSRVFRCGQTHRQFPGFAGLSEPGLTNALLGYFGGGTGLTGSALIFFCR